MSVIDLIVPFLGSSVNRPLSFCNNSAYGVNQHFEIPTNEELASHDCELNE